MMTLKEKHLFREACYINGEWIEVPHKKQMAVTNPFDGKVLGHVPLCGEEETREAIHAAQDAFGSWKALSAKERSDLLWQWAHLIDQHKEDLATLITLEEGKPLRESLGEIDYANAFIKWFAEEGRRVYGDVIPSNQRNQHLIVLKQPVGVVAAITPWNFPAAMITRKLAPALAVGCTVVAKPDEETPFTALALGYLAEKAGIPKGVLNIVTGNPEKIGAEMTGNSMVRKLSFTGSTAVGKLLMRECASSIKKVSLELGGNAPFIVFDDADLDKAVEGAMISKYRNTGQTCVCANRFLVQDTIYDAFSKKLEEAVLRLKVGNGLEKGIDQGPLINEAALLKVKAHLEDAIQHGGKVLCGGKPHALGGLFFEPTVLLEASLDMWLSREETFGPIAPLFRFKTEEEAIRLANHTEFGLASYFYSRDLDRAFRVAEGLEYGMVGINTGLLSTEVAPFGGVKYSGIGREGSKYGIDYYVEIQYLCIQGGGQVSP